MTTQSVKRYLFIAGIMGLVLGGAAASMAAVAGESGAGICGRNVAKAASVQFTVPNGPAVLERIPRLGLSPELDSITDPVTVVVFEGPHHAVPVLVPLQEGDVTVEPFTFNDVICVAVPGGEEMYYYDVDRTGLDLSGLSVDRRSE